MTVMRLAVLVLFASEQPTTSDRSIDAALAEGLADRHRLEIISEEERFVLGAELDRAVLSCGSDVSCAARRLNPLRADLALVVLINALVSPALVDARLIDVKGETQLSGRVAPHEGAAKVAQLAGAILDEAGHPKLGRIVVRTDPPEALIVIEPEPEEAVVGRIVRVSPGAYRVTASHPGHETSVIDVEVRAEETAEANLVLASSSFLSSPWFWGGAAVVVVGAVTAGVVLSTTSGGCYCLQREGAACPACP